MLLQLDICLADLVIFYQQHTGKAQDHCQSCGGSGSNLGTGGMATKLQAAQICMDCGCDMIITNGNNPTALYDILEGKLVGTTFSEMVK